MAAEVRPRLRREPARRSLQLGYLGIATRRALAGGSSNALIPTLSFDFTTGTMVSTKGNVTPTFTRATARSIIDWEGATRNILSGEVPINGLRRVRNLATFSQALDNAAWPKLNGGLGSVPVVTADFGIAPDGTQTADRFQCALNGGTALADQSWITRNGMTASGTACVDTIWLKSNTAQSYTVLFGDSPRTGVVVTPQWQRFCVPVGTSAGSWVLGLRGAQAPANSDSCDILVWGIQHEDVSGQGNQNPGEYVPTNVLSSPFSGANVDGVMYYAWQNGNTVAANVVTQATGAALPNGSTWPAGYLPEVQSTNLCLQSENFGTTWVAIGTPTRVAGALRCGNVLLDQLSDADAGTLDGYSQVITFTGNAVKAIAIHFGQGTSTSSVVRVRDTTGAADRLLATITWSVGVPTVTMTTGTLIRARQLANGVWRAEMLTTAVTAASTNQIEVYPATTSGLAVANTGNAYFGGVQAEDQTAFCSSYIVTTTVTVTRNKDQMVVSSLGAWFNAAAGALVAQLFPGTDVSAEVAASINDGTTNNRLRLYVANSGVFLVTTGAATQASCTTGAVTPAAATKLGAAYAVNDFVIVKDGVVGGTDTLGTLPALTQLEIGQEVNGSQFNGHIAKLDYYNLRTANSDEQRLTA